MINTILSNLRVWNNTTDARQKLQHTYLAATLILILGAGVIGLVDYDLGQKILLGAFICVAIFLANAVAWALLQSLVIFKLVQGETEDEGSTALEVTKKSRTPRKK